MTANVQFGTKNKGGLADTKSFSPFQKECQNSTWNVGSPSKVRKGSYVAITLRTSAVTLTHFSVFEINYGGLCEHSFISLFSILH